MPLKSILLCLLISISISFQVIASPKLPNQSLKTHLQQTISQQKSYKSKTIQSWQQQDRVSSRINFATRTGFVLLRKENIIALSIRKLHGGLLLQYWNRGAVKTATCQTTITEAMKKLDEFPFLKVSRSSIVNMDQVVEYVGTRRNAHLLMTNGTMVKISRAMARDIHDWIAG